MSEETFLGPAASIDNDVDQSECSNRTDTKLSFLQSVVMVSGAAVGGATLLSPFIIEEAGLYLAGSLLAFAVILMGFTGYLLLRAIISVIGKVGWDDQVRDPYCRVAELCGGILLRRLVLFCLTACSVCVSLGILIVVSQVVSHTFRIHSLSEISGMRVWISINTVIITPLLFLGYVKDNWLTGMFGFSTAIVSSIAILIASGYAIGYLEVGSTVPHPVTLQSIVSASGKMINFVSCVGIIGPNLVIDMKAPDEIGRVITTSSIITFGLYFMAGFVPFVAFRHQVEPNILDTLIHYGKDFQVIGVCLAIVRIFISLHSITAIVLFMNPVLQQMDLILNLPIEFSWKRAVSRTALFWLVATIGIAVPSFDTVLSVAGGVFVNYLSILFPCIIYTRIFHTSILLKSLLYTIAASSLIFSIACLYVECKSILKIYSS